MMEISGIQQFYELSNVFITGGTGFMGKILIEKLLRKTNVSVVYIMVRQKKDRNVEQVLDTFFNDKIFNQMKEICPNYRQKIQTVRGDCTLPGLGLNESDKEALISNTNIIFHLAATIRFDANLKIAYNTNTNGTKEIINLAKQMRNLKSFMHVSTAYSNCPERNIEEKIYDCLSLKQIGDKIEMLSEEDADKQTKSIIEPWPNTYTFTKALAEILIKKERGNLPIGIFRPSVIMPTNSEPISGWTDNLNGPTGICVGVISGITKVMPFDTNDSLADLVPVDMCVSGLIASAWDVGLTAKTRIPESVPVFNYVCGNSTSRVRWRQLMEITAVNGRKYDSSRNITVLFTSYLIHYWILMIYYQIIPAFFIDLFSSIRGKNTRLLRLHKKMRTVFALLSPFYTNTWNFRNDNVTQLWKKMNAEDKKLFPLSLKNIDWNIYFDNYVRGLMRDYLKQSTPSSIGLISFVHECVKTSLIFVACTTVTSVLSNYNSLISCI